MNLLLCALLFSDIVCVTQSGCRTQGTVIRIDQRGTVILTCKHGFGGGEPRRTADGWVAARGQLSLEGSETVLDKASDLALLKSKDRWPGKATKISTIPPTLPLIYVVDGKDLFRCAIHHTKPGCSGLPLLDKDGCVQGVLWGGDKPGKTYRGRSYYTRHEVLIKFLQEQKVFDGT